MPKKDPKHGLQELLQTDFARSTCNVCMASLLKGQDEVLFQRLSMTDTLADAFKEIAKAKSMQLALEDRGGDLSLIEYRAIYKPDDHEVEYVTLEEHETISKQVKSLGQISSAPNFEADKGFMAGLRFYVIIIREPNGRQSFFFRGFSPRRELTHSRYLAMWHSKDTYDQFKESLFLFDHDIDCLCREDYVFILKKANFHRIFRFFEEIMKTAEETLASIEDLDIVHGFEEFATSCRGHLQKVAKLRNIASRPYLKTLTMEKVRETITEFGRDIQIVLIDGKEKLLFDQADKWEILRLLDDDFLKSTMTDRKYVTNSKADI